LLGATLQHAVFILLAYGCVWAGWMWEDRGNRNSLWRTVLRMGVFGLLGAGLVAYMLEPTIHSILENSRSGHERGGIMYHYGLCRSSGSSGQRGVRLICLTSGMLSRKFSTLKPTPFKAAFVRSI
jgi:hypothetical protein